MEESLGAPGPRPRRINWRKLSLELIVVFLGITAGLFVNDWQLARQDAQQEQQYLAGFLQDVSGNITELEQQSQVDNAWLVRIKPRLVAAI